MVFQTNNLKSLGAVSVSRHILLMYILQGNNIPRSKKYRHDWHTVSMLTGYVAFSKNIGAEYWSVKWHR